MDRTTTVIAAVLLAMPLIASLLGYLWIRERRKRRAEVNALAEQFEALLDKHKQMLLRFQPIIDQDEEIARLNSEISSLTADIDNLKGLYAQKKSTYDRLAREVAVFDERLAFAELGVYEPHFDYTDSQRYRSEIERVRSVQKQMISDKVAVLAMTTWTVDGSAAKGQTMTNRNIRLTLRAFNNECEAAIANARWNNVNAMEKRIINARTQIDKLNESNSVVIADEYLNQKLRELYLAHEYREKLKAEKEERAEQARAAREEQRLLRDMERAEEEEARYQRLLDRAKAEAAAVAGPQLDAFNQQIKMLEKDLAEAHAKVERAQAMAERTRSGYVYIISNIGSFGESVVKIGLTRRLDPVDRVNELGDASVPFAFDTHAIIYSDDAPALERALHSEFAGVRINTENFRKEFFRASIEDVEATVKKLAPLAPFFRDIEAQEYRETLARRNAALLAQAETIELFPAEL